MPASEVQKSTDSSRPAVRVHPVPETYRIFDTTITSQIPLPELPVYQGGAPRISVRTLAPDGLDLDGFEHRHDWLDVDGGLVCRISRRDSDYVMSLPQQASFHIGREGTIRCSHAEGTPPGLMRQLLLSQVLPRYLAHTGELVLHASAVQLPNGKTVAFLGESGQGKSTLAAYCHQQGAQFIDDDAILLRCESGGVRITGGVPTLRLYSDSLRALGHNPAGFVPLANRSDKQQMLLPEGSTPSAEPRVLDALFLLDSAPASSVGDALRIERARGQAAVMGILTSAFALDPADPGTMQRTFRHAAQVLSQGLPVCHLYFPRVHALLPQVLQALLDFRGR